MVYKQFRLFELLPKHVIDPARVHGIYSLVEMAVGGQESRRRPPTEAPIERQA